MVYDLRDRVVLITGSSAGLGAVLAHVFAAEGCHIILNHSSAAENSVSRAHATESALKSAYPDRKVGIIQADCAKESDNVKLISEAISLSQSWGYEGRIDGVIANAGWTRFAAMNDLDAVAWSDFEQCFAVNVQSPFVLLREVRATFNKNVDGGFFIMTSSVAGERPFGSSLAYCVSKAANLHLMRCLAAHQGPRIRVNAVKPGVLATEWGLKFGREKLDAIINSTALKTETTLENCALIYVMLAKNDNITGEAVKIDGGVF
ncbi:hypothetical protein V1525DRAFT_404004 [Lipomyces kononenkoae]|uniref:Uncharacterized protein n=1 Tax=Lipomyces kononenkoae TaxID=34357 RepID=A0ACC3T0S1_LIPKO